MGAIYQQTSISGSKETVKKVYADIQREDRFENGNSYSGGFGMTDGLKFDFCEFNDSREAQEYLLEKAEKWGPAVAVKLRGTETYVVGAWCSE